MKKVLLILTFLLLAVGTSAQIFTYPPFESKKSEDIHIKSIVNTDIYTEINFVYKNSSSTGHYIFLRPSGHEDAYYIRANGKTFRLISTSKISNNDTVTVAEPGEAVEFTARFQKLPTTTKTFDLIEGKSGEWHFYGVKMESGTQAEEATKFRRDYNALAVYVVEKKTWGEWVEADNTFVFNVNDNGNIAHYKPNGESVIYRKISAVEKGKSDTGEEYQLIKALDEDGDEFALQFFDDENRGLRLIYDDFVIEFSNIEDELL